MPKPVSWEVISTIWIRDIRNMQKKPIGDPHPIIVGDTETYIKAAAFILDMLAAHGAETGFYSNGSGSIHEQGGSDKEDYMKLLRVLSDIRNECDIDFRTFLEQTDTAGIYFRDRTDIFFITPYIDEWLLGFARMMRKRGKNVIFYCNDDSVNDSRIIRIGRVSRFYYMND